MEDDVSREVPNQEIIKEHLNCECTGYITNPQVLLQTFCNCPFSLNAQANNVAKAWRQVLNGFTLKPSICPEKRASAIT